MLKHLYRVPALNIEATALKRTDWEKQVADWGYKWELLRADLSLFAPKQVRERPNEVRDAILKTKAGGKTNEAGEREIEIEN